MAGMRIGYANGRAATVRPLAALKMPYNVSTLGVAAAMVALDDSSHIEAERARNAQARAFTVKALERFGCRPTDSQTNFLFVDVHRTAEAFGAAGALTSSSIGGRGRENSVWSAFEPSLQAVEPGLLCISSNENPMGPGKTVLDAVRAVLGPSGAQPGRYDVSGADDLIDAMAGKFNVKPENVVLGCGSTQIFHAATHLFTAKDKPLAATIPTYEECAGYAEMMGHLVRGVSLPPDFRMHLDRMADAAKGAGLVFYCNPNNPTATYVGARATRDFFSRVEPRLARHDDSHRRGVLRLRHRSGSRDPCADCRREPAGHRRSHLLESLRPGRPPPGVRHRSPGHDQEDDGVGCGHGHELAQRAGAPCRCRRDQSGR
jgi:histidinol-phosphate/aromatic aminotransferase/cobyric acid decarboxylase-like protein